MVWTERNGVCGFAFSPQGGDCPRGAELAMSTVENQVTDPMDPLVHPLSLLSWSLALLWSMPANTLLVSGWA